MELRTMNNQFYKSLGPIDYQLGIIGGDISYSTSTAEYIPVKDDGMVSIESMKLEKMKDFIIIHEHHRGLTRNKHAMFQAASFITYQSFIHQASML